MNRMSSSFGDGVAVNSEGVSVVPAIALPGKVNIQYTVSEISTAIRSELILWDRSDIRGGLYGITVILYDQIRGGSQ